MGPQGVGIEGFTGFLSMLGVPAPGVFAWVVAFVEFVGGLALLVGAFTRVLAGPGRLSLDHLVLDTEPTPVPASASGYEG